MRTRGDHDTQHHSEQYEGAAGRAGIGGASRRGAHYADSATPAYHRAVPRLTSLMKKGTVVDASALRRHLGRIAVYVVMLLIVAGIIKLVPRIWKDVLAGNPMYVAIAMPFEILSIAGYVLLFWAVYGAAARRGAQSADTPARALTLKESMQLTTSRLAIGDTLPGGGATGFAVQFWALSRAGFNAAQISRTTTAFLVLSNTVMIVMIAIVGVLIGVGITPGHLNPLLSWLPAAAALIVIVALLWFARKGRNFVPPNADTEKPSTGRFAKWRQMTRSVMVRLPPGAHDAMQIIRNPRTIIGMLANPGFDFCVFYLGYLSVGEPLPLSIMLMAYFIGQVGSLIPVPGGIGGVQGLAIGVLVVGGAPASTATAGVLVWTGVALGTQIVWGLWQCWGLRRSTRQWEAEGGSPPTAAA